MEEGIDFLTMTVVVFSSVNKTSGPTSPRTVF